MTSDSTRKRKLFEEFQQAFLVLAFVRVDLRVRPFQVNRPQHTWRSVSGTGHENHVEIVGLNDAVQVRIYKGESGASALVPEHPIFDVFRFERLTEQWVRLQVDHAQGEIVSGPPECMKLASLFVV